MQRKRKRASRVAHWRPDEEAGRVAKALCAAYGGNGGYAAPVNGIDALLSMLYGTYTLSHYTGTTATKELLYEVFMLTKRNMERLYNDSSFMEGWDDRRKYREISCKSTHILLLQEKGQEQEIVGVVSYRFLVIDEYQPPTQVCYIYELQVNEKHRSKGVGRFLLYAAELVAKQVDAKKLMCTVLKLNKRAVSFYRDRCGFVDDESDPDVVYPEGRDDNVYHILKLTF